MMSIKDNTVLNIDAIAGLKSLPDNSIDLCVTDPPYKVISGGRAKGKGQPSGMLSKNDGKIFEHNDIDFSEWVPEVYRVLKEGSHCYIMINTLNMEELLRVCRESGFGLHNILVWEKNNVTPNRWYMKNAEYTLFLRKGKAKQINIQGSKTVHKFDNVRNKLHPTEKPVLLNKLYIENSTNPDNQNGDIVLDPFMGSFSTAIACLETNRRFVGFEVDETYYNIGMKRINEYHARGEDDE